MLRLRQAEGTTMRHARKVKLILPLFLAATLAHAQAPYPAKPIWMTTAAATIAAHTRYTASTVHLRLADRPSLERPAERFKVGKLA